MKEKKVDEGYDSSFYSLVYKRKFIRTIWWTPPTIGVILFLCSTSENIYFNIIMSAALGLIQVMQLVSNYKNWKAEEKKSE